MSISIWNEVLLIKFHAITSSITYSWTFEKYVRVNSNQVIEHFITHIKVITAAYTLKSRSHHTNWTWVCLSIVILIFTQDDKCNMNIHFHFMFSPPWHCRRTSCFWVVRPPRSSVRSSGHTDIVITIFHERLEQSRWHLPSECSPSPTDDLVTFWRSNFKGQGHSRPSRWRRNPRLYANRRPSASFKFKLEFYETNYNHRKQSNASRVNAPYKSITVLLLLRMQHFPVKVSK